MEKFGVAVAAAYIVASSLTFGVVYNDIYVPRADCGARPNLADGDRYSDWLDCRFTDTGGSAPVAAAAGAIAGALWPVYCAGRFGIWVTK